MQLAAMFRALFFQALVLMDSALVGIGALLRCPPLRSGGAFGSGATFGVLPYHFIHC